MERFRLDVRPFFFSFVDLDLGEEEEEEDEDEDESPKLGEDCEVRRTMEMRRERFPEFDPSVLLPLLAAFAAYYTQIIHVSVSSLER
jgi:glycerol-3-phosphate cytidylyltransferase-like family protein